jgi:HAD superfamily hydrolase (TIGR01509 family)
LDDFECGRLTPAAFHQACCFRLGHDLPYAEFLAWWMTILRAPIVETMALADRLRVSKSLTVGIFSNTNALHAPWLLENWPWLRGFPGVYFSYEIGLRKPDVASYLHVTLALEIDPSRTAFVDDRAENVAGAERAGLRGVLATSPAAVREGLRAAGLDEALLT